MSTNIILHAQSNLLDEFKRSLEIEQFSGRGDLPPPPPPSQDQYEITSRLNEADELLLQIMKVLEREIFARELGITPSKYLEFEMINYDTLCEKISYRKLVIKKLENRRYL
jgi:hypothetical protein